MNLKQKLREKLTEQNLSIAGLERKAGLRMSAVRNILRGQTKKPSAYTLKKIAIALNCEIDDLIVEERLVNKNDHFQREGRQKSSFKVEEPDLLQQVAETLMTILKARSLDLTIDQVLKIIKESYTFSVKSGKKTVDHHFIEWMIDKIR